MATVDDPEAQARAQQEGLARALADRNAAGLAPPPAPTRAAWQAPGTPATPQTAAIARNDPQTLVDPATGLPPDPNTTRTDANGNIFDKATGKMIMPVMAGARDLASPPIPGMPDEQHGGFAPGTYRVNPDGSILILAPQPSGRISVRAGDTVAVDGHVIGADGQPRVNHQLDQNGNIVPGGKDQPVWAPRQPDGKPASLNPNFKGDDVLTNDNGTGLVDQIPGVQSLKDLVSGGAGGVAGPAIDLGGADSEVKRTNDLADALGVERQKAGAQADTDRGLGAESRGAQTAAIGGLRDAAEGKVASAAELALTRQSGIDAARQQGLAAALQGSNPAAALRQASMGAAKVAGDTAANAAQLRAGEQANARSALASAIQNQRQQDQGAVTTDVSQQGQATQGEISSQGQGVTMTAAELDAKAKEKQAEAQREGAIVGAVGALGTGLLSDARAKENVRHANLADAIGKEVHGVTFEYKPGQGDRDPHFGLLAQELERVIPGVVKKGADGMKRVDAGQLTMGNTATLAELARRIEDLEAAGGRKKGRAA